MDPSTITAFVNLVTLGAGVVQRYSSGEITEVQAKAMLDQASDRLTSAVAAFEAAARPADAG